jgi:hypothetical protein
LDGVIELPVESLDASPSSILFFAGEAVGSVHERLEFWKEKIGADKYVLNIVKEGYRLPVFPDTEWIRYRERNNRSARDEEPFLLEEVLSLEAAGLVVRCVSQPLCCNPLSVAFKIKPDGSFKKILIIDLSQHVNRLCTDSKYCMCSLGDVLAQTVKGDFQYVFDLEAVYHHLRIHPDSFKFLGFCIMIDGCEVFFLYVVLVFGLKTAGQLLGRVLKPVLTFLAEGGVRLLVYIDGAGKTHYVADSLSRAPYWDPPEVDSVFCFAINPTQGIHDHLREAAAEEDYKRILEGLCCFQGFG